MEDVICKPPYYDRVARDLTEMLTMDWAAIANLLQNITKSPTRSYLEQLDTNRLRIVQNSTDLEPFYQIVNTCFIGYL